MNIKTSNPTVDSYVKAFIDSDILNKINRFYVHEKKTLSTVYKYYSVDIG